MSLSYTYRYHCREKLKPKFMGLLNIHFFIRFYFHVQAIHSRRHSSIVIIIAITMAVLFILIFWPCKGITSFVEHSCMNHRPSHMFKFILWFSFRFRSTELIFVRTLFIFYDKSVIKTDLLFCLISFVTVLFLKNCFAKKLLISRSLLIPILNC